MFDLEKSNNISWAKVEKFNYWVTKVYGESIFGLYTVNLHISRKYLDFSNYSIIDSPDNPSWHVSASFKPHKNLHSILIPEYNPAYSENSSIYVKIDTMGRWVDDHDCHAAYIVENATKGIRRRLFPTPP